MDRLRQHLAGRNRYFDRPVVANLVRVVVIVGVAALGAYLIRGSHAATLPIGSVEAESSARSGAAAVVADADASGESVVRFGTHSGIPTVVQTGELSTYIPSNASTLVPLCLDDKNNSSANNNPVVANPCSTASVGQQWSLYTDNTIRINGKCLGTSGNSTANGAAVVISTCISGDRTQQWSPGTDPSVSFNDLVNGGSQRCLNLPGVTADDPTYDSNNNNVLNGTALNIVSCNGGVSEQVWGWNTNGAIVPGGDTVGANCHYAWIAYGGYGECYWEAHGIQQQPFSATGYSVDITGANPTVPVYEHNNPTSHTTDEVWAGGGDPGTGGGVSIGDGIPGDAVEFGWIKNGDGVPAHLFATAWQNNTLLCNPNTAAEAQACGFVSTSGSVRIGTAVTPGATDNYKVVYANSQWQFWYNGTEVGYYPSSVWTSLGDHSFTSITYLDLYGEVAIPLEVASKTQMGNGVLGSQAGSTAFSNLTLIGSSSAPALTYGGNNAPGLFWENVYDRGNAGPTGFSVGGPGL